MNMPRSVLGMVVLVTSAAACGGRAYPDAASTDTVTSVTVGAPGAESISDRIARAVCIHEVECGRSHDPGMCIDTSRMRTARELATWTCDPESARVAAEQCLVSVGGAPCSIDLSASEYVCAENGGCARVETDRPEAAR